jgi:putative peptidoglycan lipid II flippase
LFLRSLGVYGLALGAVLGAVLHLGVQLPAVRRYSTVLRPRFVLRTDGVGEVLRLLGPRIVGQAAVQMNFVVNTALTSGMARGDLTALTYAFRLMFAVLGVLGQSVGTAVFPSLAALGARDDVDGFRETLVGALRSVLFTSIPATVGLMVLAYPLVATIFSGGAWTQQDTISTMWALQFFAVGLSAFALQEILARAFYALRDTATPVAVAVGGVIVNVILSLVLIRVFGDNRPFGGLALANALATMGESAVLWILLRRRIKHLNDRAVLSMVGQVGIAAAIMGAFVYLSAALIRDWSPIFVLIIPTMVGVAVFQGITLALNIPESRTVFGAIVRRIRRA